MTVDLSLRLRLEKEISEKRERFIKFLFDLLFFLFSLLYPLFWWIYTQKDGRKDFIHGIHGRIILWGSSSSQIL